MATILPHSLPPQDATRTVTSPSLEIQRPFASCAVAAPAMNRLAVSAPIIVKFLMLSLCRCCHQKSGAWALLLPRRSDRVVGTNYGDIMMSSVASLKPSAKRESADWQLRVDLAAAFRLAV